MYNKITLDKCLTALISVVYPKQMNSRGEGNTEDSSEKDIEIPLHAPHFGANEWDYVKSCLDTGWVSSVGKYVDLFERKLSEYTGALHAVAVMNGTAALQISLILAGVEPQDEILMPSLTFVATANAASYTRAIPHFIDASFINLGIDLEKLEHYLKEITILKNEACFNKFTSRRIKAIVPVHIYGHCLDMDKLNDICKKYHLVVIEDASEALGSFYKGKHAGVQGDIGVLSFNGNKIITTGGGGAILLKNREMAKRAKHITATARQSHRFEFYHDEIGYNYRMPNLNAALGCAQLEQLPHFVVMKRNLAKKYREAFHGIQGVEVLQEQMHVKSNYWLNALVLKTRDRKFVEDFIESAHDARCALRGLWAPLHRLPMYKACPKMDLSNTAALFDSVIALPSSAMLGQDYA